MAADPALRRPHGMHEKFLFSTYNPQIRALLVESSGIPSNRKTPARVRTTFPRGQPMPIRRFVVIALSIAMLSASIPAPVFALPTSTEVSIGKEYDKQITDQTV